MQEISGNEDSNVAAHLALLRQKPARPLWHLAIRPAPADSVRSGIGTDICILYRGGAANVPGMYKSQVTGLSRLRLPRLFLGLSHTPNKMPKDTACCRRVCRTLRTVQEFQRSIWVPEDLLDGKNGVFCKFVKGCSFQYTTAAV